MAGQGGGVTLSSVKSSGPSWGSRRHDLGLGVANKCLHSEEDAEKYQKQKSRGSRVANSLV